MTGGTDYLATAGYAGLHRTGHWQFVAESGDAARLLDVCKEMEAVFLDILLREMFKTSIPVAGAGSELYQHLYIQELSRHVAGSGGIGLADMMFRHLATEPKHGGETAVSVESDKDNTPE